MTRLEKKCFIASAGTHALLMLLLFSAPVLMATRKENIQLPVLTFLPSVAVDQMVVGGGSPNVTEAPAPAPIPQPAPPPTVVPPTPAPQQRIRPEPPTPAPVKTETPKARTPTRESLETRRQKEPAKTEAAPAEVPRKDPPKRKIEPVFVDAVPTRTADAAREAREKARSEEIARARAAQQAFAAQVAQSIERLGSGLSSGTSIEVPGPGGAAYADYGLIIQAIYGRAWIPPAELNGDSAVVRAKVVVRRDGKVIEARILKPSGNRALDRSVQRALEIQTVPPFPDGAKDFERTFHIDFDLKTKRQFG